MHIAATRRAAFIIQDPVVLWVWQEHGRGVQPSFVPANTALLLSQGEAKRCFPYLHEVSLASSPVMVEGGCVVWGRA